MDFKLLLLWVLLPICYMIFFYAGWTLFVSLFKWDREGYILAFGIHGKPKKYSVKTPFPYFTILTIYILGIITMFGLSFFMLYLIYLWK